MICDVGEEITARGKLKHDVEKLRVIVESINSVDVWLGLG